MLMLRLDDAKYPGQISGLPPSPTVENPGRVCLVYFWEGEVLIEMSRYFPLLIPNEVRSVHDQLYAKMTFSGPFVSPRRAATPEQFAGNPFLMNNALDKLDHAFGEVMVILEQEASSQGRDIGGNSLFSKLRSWKDELERIRLGEEESSDTFEPAPPKEGQEGGLFTD